MGERYQCTRETPWIPTSGPERVHHHETEEVREQQDGWPGGDIIRVKCTNCGTVWYAELPQ